jgi:hypothetical protein
MAKCVHVKVPPRDLPGWKDEIHKKPQVSLSLDADLQAPNEKPLCCLAVLLTGCGLKD